jgi:DNA repair exonuclease SbcCD ATPase subunit
MNIVELVSITLHNYKVHRNLTVEFKTGVTGIIGTNGKGKSTVVSAIQFLFTGELDVDSKAEAITLGETEGWVSGRLLLHGKPAYLERHLGASKVILEYDGKRYTKAADVKELWAKLLQIDSIVFRNVIVAGQGEIQLLFNGESAVRERIFQKIFLVPATEKLRATIWGYIKNCPPEIPEEDIPGLEAAQATLAHSLNVGGREIDQLKIQLLPDVAVGNLAGRIQYLQGCLKDATLKPVLEAQLNTLVARNDQVYLQSTELAQSLQATPIAAFKQSRTELLMLKGQKQQQETLRARLAKLIALLPVGYDANTLAANEQLLSGYRESAAEALAQLAVLKTEQQTIAGQLTRMQQLNGKSSCPTCDQPVTCTAEHIAAQKTRLTDVEAKQRELTGMLKQRQDAANKLANHNLEMQLNLQTIGELNEQLNQCSAINFTEEDLAVVNEAIAEFDVQSQRLVRLEQQVTQLNGEINVVNAQLAALKSYSGSMTNAEEELALMQEVQLEHEKRREQIRQLETKQAVTSRELELIAQRISASADNHRKNAARRDYLQVLQGVYDLMHSSKFPRALIQSYSQYVEYYLKLNLENFGLPFGVSLGESFNLIVKDELERVLPGVSGGQAVILGICLRLALHKLFAQSFPIWIVDEGTTHLDAKNRKLYFQLIEALKRDATINQIIIIDHDPMLSTVVDQTVEL